MSNVTADIIDQIEDILEEKKEDQDKTSTWFKVKIGNNVTKYVLDGTSTKITKEFFSLDGTEDSIARPTSKSLADYMNSCVKNDNPIESFGYDKDLMIGVKTINLKEKNPDSCQLPPGCYSFHKSQSGQEGLVPLAIRSDAYLDLDGTMNKAKNSIKKFLERRSVYTKNKIIYKLGMLMYGLHGTGKTALLRNLIQKEIPKDAVVVFLGELPSSFLTKMAEVLTDDVLKVFVFEEFTEVEDKIKRNGGTDKLLQFLDGEFSIENSIVIATTNYPEKISANMVDRPGRFDKLYKFETLSTAAAKKLLEYFLEREVTPEELAKVQGKTAAALREMCLLQTVEDCTFLEAVTIMEERKKACQSGFKDYKPGF